MHTFAFGLFAAFLAAVSWGVQLPLAADVFATVDPFHVTSVRYLFASLCLIPVLVWFDGWRALSYRGGALAAIVLGVLGMCGSPMLVFYGMSFSRAEHAVVIVSLQPAVAVLAYWILRGQRPANFTLGCIVAAFIGVVLVVTKGDISGIQSASQLFGDVVIFLGAVCWVVYTIGIARLAHWSIWRITVLTMIPGAIATSLLTAGLVAVDYLRTPSAAAVVSVGWELAYLTFVGVLLAMLAWNFGTRRIGAMNATLLINCMPVTTFIYRALQGHRFAMIEVAGALIVVAALIANNLFLRAEHLRIRRLAA